MKVKAKVVLEYGLKILIVIIFLCLTLKDFISLLIDFCGDNTITFANATWDNDTLYVQNFSLCVALAPIKWWDNDNDSTSKVNVWSPNILSIWHQSMDILKKNQIFNTTLEKLGDMKNLSMAPDELALIHNYPQPYDTKVAFAVAFVNAMSTFFGLAMGMRQTVFDHDPIYENTFAYIYLNVSR